MTPPRLPARILVGPALRAQPDRRLVALAREGHEPAVEEVVRRYRPALVRYAATIVPPHRADDVVQDSIARALPTLRGGEAELHLRPWLYTIVRNAALNSIRDAGPAMDHLDESFDGVEQPPQALERREELAAVVAGVQALPDSQREALVRREIEGKSHAEIGAAMGVSVAAARQLIHRGRVSLREGLGALIPMPVMRQLLEGFGAPAAAGTGAGGALATKAVVAVLAAGGAVGAGVALHRHSHPPAKPDPIVAERGAQPLDAAETGGGAVPGSGPGAVGEAGEHGSRGASHGGPGSSSNGSSRGSSGDSTGDGGRRGEGFSEDRGPRSGSAIDNSGHGGGEHHGGVEGGEHSGESPDGGEHHGGGGSGGGGSGSGGGGDDGSGGSGSGGGGSEGTSGGTEGGSSGGGGHTGESSSNHGSGETSSGDGGTSGSGKREPNVGSGPALPADD